MSSGKKSVDKKPLFVKKGETGYFASEKKRRLLITLGLFFLPLTVFFIAWAVNHSRETVWTVITVVGCLPACKSLVDLIMILRCKSPDQSELAEIKAHAGSLTMAYELYMTFYEKSGNVTAFAICGGNAVGYCPDEKADLSALAVNTREILKKNGYRQDVKLVGKLPLFLERLDGMNENAQSFRSQVKDRKDDRYEGMSREEVVRHLLLTLSL